jgi:hypothetical protein
MPLLRSSQACRPSGQFASNVASDFPTSQEYLATDGAHPFFGYHRVFAWNSSILHALEHAPWRRPETDPDHFTK